MEGVGRDGGREGGSDGGREGGRDQYNYQVGHQTFKSLPSNQQHYIRNTEFEFTSGNHGYRVTGLQAAG